MFADKPPSMRLRRMIRAPSFKCLLFVLVLVVVGLTLGFIARTTPSPHPQGRAQYPGADSYYKSFNYYQNINEDDDAKPSQDDDGSAAFPKKTSLKKKSFQSFKNERTLDYPFDEEEGENSAAERIYGKDNKAPREGITDITCNVNNGKYKLECKKEGSEVYIPFSFIRSYFEIYGKLEEPKDGEEQTFTWLHSLIKIYRPTSPYNPKGIFTYFENYNVEVRDRVKCISGAEGVPVSTQWDINGYFYPIQIAQFGLSHFSKFFTEGEPKRIVLDDGDETRGGWQPQELVTTLPNDNSDPTINHYLQFGPTSNELFAKLEIGVTKPRMLMLSWEFKVNGDHETKPNVTFTASVRYESQIYYLHYVTEDFLIKAKDNHVYHGLGYKSSTSFHHVIRDLGVDLQKGIVAASGKLKKSKILKIAKSKLALESFSIASSSSPSTSIVLDNLTLATNEHLAQFYQAADWFVASQDKRGGWPIPVRRKFGPDFYPVLEPGWYSAMGQGHALSLLARAYSVSTNNSIYSAACAKALNSIFDRSGSQHGVQAVFLDRHIWYEEYPTTPSSFVLNGFMYALLGLYDVKALNVEGAGEKASELYASGLSSLKTMLPLFDTGSGSFYDLRHFSVPGISPNLARLDYHVTHINQLLTFATFEKDGIFRATAERWIGYAEGDRAAHN